MEANKLPQKSRDAIRFYLIIMIPINIHHSLIDDDLTVRSEGVRCEV